MYSNNKVLALKYRPQTFDQLIGQKVIAESIFNSIKNNKIQEAIKLFDNALKLNPTSFEVCSRLGLLSFQLGELDNSISYFKKTLLLNPKSSLS